jgi:hypothetical protein
MCGSIRRILRVAEIWQVPSLGDLLIFGVTMAYFFQNLLLILG